MRKLLAFLAVVAVTACDSRIGSSFVAPVTPSIVGTFKLQTFNGKALPTVLSTNATSTLTLVGDTLMFSKDGLLRRASAVTVTTPPGAPIPQTVVASGTYKLTNADVTLTLPNSSGTGFFTVPGTLSNGSTLTLNDAGDVWVYSK
jgi:hypothetical protein